ncbi:MAG: efflux RND transporter periplasmic adaptor subunit [Syntrophobacteraceae bacterium]
MKKPVSIILLTLLVVGSFLGGVWFKGRTDSGSPEGEKGRKVLCYVDPMNPAHTSDQPGTAPCGMPMEPVYADDGEEGQGAAARFLPAGSAKISAERQQLLGVRVERAERTHDGHALRTLGRVAADENRTYGLNAGDDGWVWKVLGGTTGSLVQKDQLLATIYNYPFLTRQQQYLYALDFEQRRQRPYAPGTPAQQVGAPPPAAQQGARPSGEQGAGASQHAGHGAGMPMMGSVSMVPVSPGSDGMSGGSAVYSTRDQLSVAKLELYNLGVSEHQLQEIAKNRQITLELELRAPVTGIVLSRSITPQSKFTKGTELFRIADLSKVWILTDVFEREADYVKPGVPVRVSLPMRGKTFEAWVTDVPPVFDPVSRSYKVRLEAENPDLELRADMFVDVEFILHFPETLTVPTDAVLDTGKARTVFVSVGNGYFEPRMVETGRRFGGRVEILQGIMPGEEIVVSGNFFVDSESKMKLAASGMQGEQEKDPVCAMPVYSSQARKAGLTAERDGKVYYFCSEQCRKAFLDAPDHYAKTPTDKSRPQGGVAAGGKEPKGPASPDPVCRMEIDPRRAGSAGLSTEYRGRTYHFCSEECRDQFLKHPDRYVGEKAEAPTVPAQDGRSDHVGHAGHASPMGHSNPGGGVTPSDHGSPADHTGHAMPPGHAQQAPPATTATGGSPEQAKGAQ